MKRVLVTGASGFIGRHCVEALLRSGAEVHAARRSRRPGLPGVAETHSADLLNEEQRRRLLRDVRPSHVLHAAWEVTPGRYRQSANNVAWMTASIDLLRESFEVGAERVVGIGTCFEYDLSQGWCREEQTPCWPVSLYGKSKLAVARAFEAASAAGYSAAWGRIFFPFGPGEPRSKLIPSLILAQLRGEPYECSHGRQLRDFVYVENVASAITALLHGGPAGVFNVASGQPRSLQSLILNVATTIGRPDLLRFGAHDAAGEDAEPLIAGPIDGLRRAVGWEPPVSFEAALQKTIAWWRDRSSSTSERADDAY